MAKRRYRTGGIEERGKNTYRLRYSIEGKRYKKTITADCKSDEAEGATQATQGR